jgi:DNA-binding LacI/PurR family transcriptional regulator
MFFVHETIKPHCSVVERQAGYRAEMARAGLEFNESIQLPEEDAIDVLMRSGTRPTAVLCYSNLEATLIMHAMWQLGVSIPGDLSVVGFNDNFAVEHMTPPLTTVAFDAAKIGELGAQLVLDSIDRPEPVQLAQQARVHVIKPKLIVRGSTGPCRSGRLPMN